MAHDGLILAIDQGTTGTTALVIDKQLAIRVLTAQPAMGRYVAKGLLADPDVARLIQ